MDKFHITGSQKFYGTTQPYTYYNVSKNKIEAGCEYLCKTFNLPVIFIYEAAPIGSNHNRYIGCYSARWKNFTINGLRSARFNP